MMSLVLQPEVPSVPFSLLAFPPSLWDDLLAVKAQRPPVFVPLFIPSWVSSLYSLCSLRSRLCDPACCPLPFSICVVNAPGPSVRASRCHDPSSLCAPRDERSDPVSTDGVLQKPRNLLTVLLIYEGIVNKFTGKVFGGVSWKDVTAKLPMKFIIHLQK